MKIRHISTLLRWVIASSFILQSSLFQEFNNLEEQSKKWSTKKIGGKSHPMLNVDLQIYCIFFVRSFDMFNSNRILKNGTSQISN